MYLGPFLCLWHYNLQSHEYNSEPTFPTWEGTLLDTSSLGAKLETPLKCLFFNNHNLVKVIGE